MADALSASCKVELNSLGFSVTRDGEPVPPRAFPPALLTFASRTYARAFAKALDAAETSEAHRLIAEHGRWWR